MTALGAVVVVGAGQRHLQIELPQRGSPVEDLLELAVGQVHSEQGVVCVDEGIHIVVVFQQGVLHLLVILGQGLALVEGGALVPEILEAHEEVVQPPMEVGVAEQEGQPPALGHAVGLKIQLKLLPDGQPVFHGIGSADETDILAVGILRSLKAASLNDRGIAGVEPEHALQIIR